MGELLWDDFPDGKRLGGAPANVAFHAAKLGATAILWTRVGKDELGDRAVAEVARAGVDVSSITRDSKLPTGTVQVKVEAGEPHYSIAAPAAWDRLTAPRALAVGTPEVRPPHAFVFGTLAARTKEQARRLLGLLERMHTRTGERTHLVLDLNLRPPHVPVVFIQAALRLVDVLKLNEDELTWLTELLGLDGDEPARIQALFERTALDLVAVTRGARGASLYSRASVAHAPGIPVIVGDAVGAGDAFLAALLVSLLRGQDLEASLRAANQLAAHVASSRGAMSSS